MIVSGLTDPVTPGHSHIAEKYQDCTWIGIVRTTNHFKNMKWILNQNRTKPLLETDMF